MTRTKTVTATETAGPSKGKKANRDKKGKKAADEVLVPVSEDKVKKAKAQRARPVSAGGVAYMTGTRSIAPYRKLPTQGVHLTSAGEDTLTAIMQSLTAAYLMKINGMNTGRVGPGVVLVATNMSLSNYNDVIGLLQKNHLHPHQEREESE